MKTPKTVSKMACFVAYGFKSDRPWRSAYSTPVYVPVFISVTPLYRWMSQPKCRSRQWTDSYTVKATSLRPQDQRVLLQNPRGTWPPGVSFPKRSVLDIWSLDPALGPGFQPQ
ncbi:unnamed protein product [Notodromas monacha]|uniref:Uncharacterized protein n=1 Tax=Notodromas monacha TaxID=399045 RepID=A0A7R9GHN0_9CRUS|nr:unnamed protein product [Notodromas monacha]CAG0923078.1 unnamed protein product [Notodromas monacha]